MTGNGAQDDDQTGITLMEVPGQLGIFVSQSQLLTAPNLPGLPAAQTDDGFAADDGNGAKPADDQPGDRTHHVDVDGAVRIIYDNEQAIKTNLMELVYVSSPDNVQSVIVAKRLKLHVHVFNELGMAWTVLGTREQATAYVDAEIRRASILWAQAGIEVEREGAISFEEPPAGTVADGQFDVGAVKPQADVTALIARDGSAWQPTRLEVYWVPSIYNQDVRSWDRGWTAVAAAGANIGQGERTVIFVASRGPTGPVELSRVILAHEIGHALTNGTDLFEPEHVFFPRLDPSVPVADNQHFSRITPLTTRLARAWRRTGHPGDDGSQLLEDWN